MLKPFSSTFAKFALIDSQLDGKQVKLTETGPILSQVDGNRAKIKLS
jgi:hypothetical protein